MKLLCWSISDPGRKRDHNEDSFLGDDGLRLYAVADGMGGHQGGEQASRLACEVLQREVQHASGRFDEAAQILSRRGALLREDDITTSPVLRAEFEEEEDPTMPARPITEPMDDSDEATAEGLGGMAMGMSPAAVVMSAAARKAGHEIYDAAQVDPNLRGMGTTLTAMVYDSGAMHFVHAGDSRAYLYRDGKLKQLTDDHSWINEQVKAGTMTEAEAKESKFRHIITRSVGFEPDVEVDTAGVIVQAGDLFLLCSDGMSNYVENDELERIIGLTWFRRVPQVLVDVANERGGDDNITVLVVYAANDAD